MPKRAAFGGRSVVGRVRIPTKVLISVGVTSQLYYRTQKARQAKFPFSQRVLLRAAVNMVWGSTNV
jgi:hypothetical protein